MKDKISDLRSHLFDTLRELRSDDMEMDRAKAICEVAKQITDSAKVEVDYLRATEQTQGTGFIQDESLPASRMRMINGGDRE